jgi:hypothetical protein
MQDTRWDHALKVTGGGTGLVGHAGAVLLRKAADQAGLTAGLSAALRKAGTSPLLDRGIVLVSMAAAIALGAKTEYMDEAIWLPSPRKEMGGSTLTIARQYPHAIFVNKRGQRFVNEANSYVEVGRAMYANDSRGWPSPGRP